MCIVWLILSWGLAAMFRGIRKGDTVLIFIEF